MAKINKVLSDSNTYGATKRWVLANGASPLTTKGDVYTYSTTNARLGVGSDGYVLTADSSEATGLKWAASTSANYYLTALSFGTDSKITGSMSGVSNITGNAMTTFTPATTFVAEASFTTGLVVGGNSTAAGYIKINPDTDDTGDFPTTLKVGVNTEAQTYTLPLAYPASSGYALVSTDAGVMSWAVNQDGNYYVTGGTYSAGAIAFSGTTSFPTFSVTGIPTGTLTGGGTNNYVAHWTSATNVTGTAGFQYDADVLSLTSATANLPKISITNTTDDNSAPLLDFIKDRDGTAAASDDLGGIRFYGDDAGGTQHNFARIDVESPVVTAGSEDGSIKFRTTAAGTDNAGVMILSGSNVGIGRINPESKLHIDGGAYLAQFSRGTGDFTLIQSDNTNNLIFASGTPSSNTEMMIINSTSVGIGTTAPDNQTKLDIVGKVYQKVDANGNINYGSGSFAHGSGITNYTGYYSSIIGIQAGYYISGNAHRNTAVGYRAMYGASTGQQSSDNTAIGASALLDLGAGNFNTAVGSSAGENITGGEHNIYVGYNAGRLTTIGHKNVAIGTESLYDNVHGDFNIGIGSGSLYNTTPDDGEGKNIAIGTNAGAQNTTGTGNIFIGDQAGNHTTWQTEDDKLVIANSATTTPLIYGDFSAATLTLNGSLTIASTKTITMGGNAVDDILVAADAESSGDDELTTAGYVDARYAPVSITGTIAGTLSDNYLPIGTAANTIGDFVLGLTEDNGIWIGSDPSSVTDTATGSVALGITALDSVTTGDGNTAIGRGAGTAINTGEYNTFVGHKAGEQATTSSYNNFFGNLAGYSGTRGNQNNAFGYYAMSIQQGTNNVAMGHNAMQGEAGADNDESVGVGAYALRNISGTADMNTAVGYAAMQGAATGITAAGQYNTAVGNRAMRDLTSGYGNVAMGRDALRTISSGYSNVAIGYQAGYSVAAGRKNVAVGNQAGYSMATGTGSVMVGEYAGGNNTADYNVGVGFQALDANTSGDLNIGIGKNTLGANTTGNNNVALGHEALLTNVDGDYNIAMGNYALYTLEPADGAGKNVGIGHQAGYAVTTGTGNIGIGYRAAYKVTTTNNNIAIGNQAMEDATGAGSVISIGEYSGYNPTGANNIFMGYKSGYGNASAALTAYSNVGIGKETLMDVTSGYQNVALGQQAGYNVTTGHTNTMVGGQAARGQTTANGNTAIGYDSLYKTTIGSENVAVGKMAGYNYAGTTSALYGAFSTFLGYAAGYAVTGGNSYGHVIAIGHQPMYNATGANKSMAIGNSALVSGTDALDMIAIGQGAGAYGDATGSVYIGNKAGFRPSGNYNVAIGHNAMSGASSGTGFGTATLNVAIGREAMLNVTSANNSVAIGYQAGASIVDGDDNTLVGYKAGNAINGGTGRNVMVGSQAGQSATTTDASTIIGYQAAGGSALTGDYNTAVGFQSGYALIGAVEGNVLLGHRAGYGATSGGYNTFIGYAAGQNVTTGADNVIIGKNAGPSSTNTESDKLYINNAAGTPLIGGDFSAKTLTFTADTVNINSTSSNKPELIIKNTNADTSPSFLKFLKRGEDAADGDEIGQIQFIGQDDHTSPNDVTYGDIYVTSEDVSEGTEDGSMNFRVMSGGTLTGVMSMGYDGNSFGMNLFTASGTGLNQINTPNNTNFYLAFGSDLSYTETSSGDTVKPPMIYRSGNPDPNDSGGDAQLFIQSQDDVSIMAGEYSVNGSGNDIILRTSDAAHAGSTSRMRVKGDGKIGIGTDAPDKLLDVRGGGTTWALAALSGSNSHGTGLQLYNSNTTVQDWAIIGGGASHNYSFRIYDQTDALYRFAVDRDGKVGIGGSNAEIVAPDIQLDIKATGTAKSNLDMLSLTNKVNAADMDGTETSIKFNQWYYDASSPATEDSGRITVGTLNDWTTSAGTRDSEMSFDISIDGTMYQMGRFNPDGFIIDEYTRLARNTSTNGLYVSDSGGNPVKVATASGATGGFSLDNTTANTIYRGAGVSYWDSTESYRLQGNSTSGYLQLDMNKITLVRSPLSTATSVLQIGDSTTYDQFSILEDARGSTATNGYLKLRAKKTGNDGYAKISLGAISGSTTSELLIDSIAANEALRFDTNSKSHAFDIAKAGYVSVGGAVDSTNQFTVVGTTHLSGAVTVVGTLSATAKSFNIEHPLYKDKRLVHGSLEGPEHGIYIRGTIEAKEYGCEIELPEYWSAMCDDYTVQLTSHGPYTVYIKEKQKDKVMIACTSKDYKFDYYVVGSRTDETLEVVQNG